MFLSKTNILSFALIASGILFVQIFDISPVDSLDQSELIQSSDAASRSISDGIRTALPSSGVVDAVHNDLSFLFEISEKFETAEEEEQLKDQARMPIGIKSDKDARFDPFNRVILAEPEETIAANQPTIKFYQVESGDTSISIADVTGLDVDMLRMVNHIGDGESIFKGQNLFIPSNQDLEISLTEELQWPFEYDELPFVVSQHFKGIHLGIDFDLPKKSPIRASASGLVTFAGWDPVGYGNMILIYHGDEVFTLYAHLDSIKVAVGDSVSQSSVIGYAGNTGFSSNTHLHFEILHRFTTLNPCYHIKSGCSPKK